jgi:hypothetical protein
MCEHEHETDGTREREEPGEERKWPPPMETKEGTYPEPVYMSIGELLKVMSRPKSRALAKYVDTYLSEDATDPTVAKESDVEVYSVDESTTLEELERAAFGHEGYPFVRGTHMIEIPVTKEYFSGFKLMPTQDIVDDTTVSVGVNIDQEVTHMGARPHEVMGMTFEEYEELRGKLERSLEVYRLPPEEEHRLKHGDWATEEPDGPEKPRE